MRRFILLAAVALPFRAQATLPVIDMASIGHLVQEVQQLRQNYQQLRATYQMFTNIHGINGAISAFQMSGLENAMPATGEMPGMIGGGYAPGQMGGYAQQYYQQDNPYIPQGSDWAARSMRGNANSTAAIQSLATENLASIQNRESVVMPRLQNEIASARSITDLQNVQSQIGVENAYIASEGAQAQSLQLAAYEQTQAQRQAVEEENRQGADQAIASTCQSIAADGGSSGLCP